MKVEIIKLPYTTENENLYALTKEQIEELKKIGINIESEDIDRITYTELEKKEAIDIILRNELPLKNILYRYPTTGYNIEYFLIKKEWEEMLNSINAEYFIWETTDSTYWIYDKEYVLDGLCPESVYETVEEEFIEEYATL